MKTIYAIRDRVANDLTGYFPLVCFRTDAQAVRYFTDSLQQEKSMLAQHPNDFELIKLGTVTDHGDIVARGPEIILTGTALLATQEPNLKLEEQA